MNWVCNKCELACIGNPVNDNSVNSAVSSILLMN
jgi:hypothetical protein